MGKPLVPIVRTNGGVPCAASTGVDHEFDRGRARGVHAQRRAPGFYWQVMRPEEYEAGGRRPARRDTVSSSEHAVGATRRLDRPGRGSAARQRRSPLHDRAATTTIPRCWRAGPARRRARRGLRGPPGRPGRRAHDDHGRAVDARRRGTRRGRRARRRSRGAIEASVAEVPDVARCVFNLHCPPKDTPIDTCLKLERSLAPASCHGRSRRGGRFLTTGGGSLAVREAISRYQPTRRAPRPHPRVGRPLPLGPDATASTRAASTCRECCRAGSSRSSEGGWSPTSTRKDDRPDEGYCSSLLLPWVPREGSAAFAGHHAGIATGCTHDVNPWTAEFTEHDPSTLRRPGRPVADVV